MEETSVGVKDTVDALEAGKIRSLEDVHNIESALQMINQSQKEIEQYKELKKKRVQVIDQMIENLQSRIDFLKSLITQTLNEHGQKQVKFPGLGKVHKRTKKGKWVINDESSLKEALKQEGEYDHCVKIEEKINKTEANKVLDTWESVDKLPTGVEREEETETITVSFEKDVADKEIEAPAPKPQNLEAGNDGTASPYRGGNGTREDLNVYDFS